MALIVFTLNRDPKQAVRLSRYFAAAGTSLLAIGLLFACEVQGVISQAAFLAIASVTLLAILAFYIVFRSGLNLKLADPSLTEPQMLTAIVVILYAMYSANYGRGIFLTLLLMAFLFGVLHLKTRALLLYLSFILGGLWSGDRHPVAIQAGDAGCASGVPLLAWTRYHGSLVLRNGRL